MKSLVKFFLFLVLGLVALVVIAAVALPLFINPNDYKGDIEAQVQKHTGRQLQIVGDIGLSFSFPLSVAFELGESQLSNAEGFGDKPFASIKQISVNAAIFPLLQENKLEIGKVLVDHVFINLIRNKDGKANWDDLAKPQKPSGKPESTKQEEPQKGQPKKIPEIHIAGIEVINTHLIFDDQLNGQYIELDNFAINISELVENKPVNIDIATDFASTNLKLDGKFGLKSSATIDLKQQRFEFAQSTFDLNINGPSIPEGKNNTQLVGNILIDLSQQMLNISDLKLSSFELDLRGDLKAKQLLSKPTFNGSLQLASFSPKKLMQTLQIAVPAFKNDKALNAAQVKMEFSGTPDKIQLNSLDAQLDEMTFKGSATIQNLNKPAYIARLNINKLHPDDYALKQEQDSPKKTKQEQTKGENPTDKPAQKPQSAKIEQPLIPVELLRQLNIDGQIKIGEVLASGVKMTNIVLSLKGKNGLVQLAPIKSDFYKGKLDISSTIDIRKDTPKIKFKQDFKQIDLGQLLQDATGTQEFTGTANISSNITTSGNLQSVLIKNINGNAKLLVTDGHIKKLDILHTLRKAQAIYKGEAMPSSQQEANTEFTELKGTMKIKNGVIKNNDLSSKSPVMALTGKGYVDLPKEYLDYTLSVQLLNTLSINEKSGGTDYRSYKIPYTIKGKFNELSQQADMKKVLAEQAKNEIKKSLQKKLNKQFEGQAGDKLKEKLGDDVGKKLKDMFKF